MGIHIEGIEDVYMFILVVLFGTLGDYLDEHPMGGYHCPIYCEVDHKHIMEIDGYLSDTGAVRDTRSSYDSLWVFHLETEPLYSEGTTGEDRD